MIVHNLLRTNANLSYDFALIQIQVMILFCSRFYFIQIQFYVLFNFC